jgi:hypothetical protein
VRVVLLLIRHYPCFANSVLSLAKPTAWRRNSIQKKILLLWKLMTVFALGLLNFPSLKELVMRKEGNGKVISDTARTNPRD